MWMISYDRVALLTIHIKTTAARTPSFERRPLWPINLDWNLRDRSISHPAAALFRLQGASWKQRAVAALWVWRSLGPADPEFIFSAVNGWTFLLWRQMLCVRNSSCPSMNHRPFVWDYLCVCVWHTVSDVSIHSRKWQNIESKICVFAEPVLRTEEFCILPSHLNRCFSSLSPADQVLTIHTLCICSPCWCMKTVFCNKLLFGYIRGGRCPSGALYILISATLNLNSTAFNLPASLVFSQSLCKHNIKSLEILLCYNDMSFLLKTSNCSQAFEGCSYWFLSLYYLELYFFSRPFFFQPHCNAVAFQIDSDLAFNIDIIIQM